MRCLLVSALVMLTAAPAASAGPAARTIATDGTAFRLPAGWHALVAWTPSCDPERLVVASSARLRISPHGVVAAPRPGQVVVFLLEDRFIQDRPTGNLQRPARFTIAWDHLIHLEGPATCEGLPFAPAFMRYFETHGRYIGFIVYPGAMVDTLTKLDTLALMDSLRVAAFKHQP